MPKAPIKKNKPHIRIKIHSNANAKTKVCLLDLPVAFLHIPYPSSAIKPPMQNSGKTTPAAVKMTISICHCKPSKNRMKTVRTSRTPKIEKMLLCSFLCCSFATSNVSFIASDASSLVTWSVVNFSAFISSRMDTPKASASGSIVLISGKPTPLSHRLTALSVTFIFTASSAYVIFFSFRHPAINPPNFSASILPSPFSIRI